MAAENEKGKDLYQRWEKNRISRETGGDVDMDFDAFTERLI